MRTGVTDPTTRPDLFYMPRDTGVPDPDNPPYNIIAWDLETVQETGYPAGTAVIKRRSGDGGYQMIQASPDTIAIWEGPEEHLLQTIFQTWVYLEVYTDHWTRPNPIDKFNTWDEENGIVTYQADYGSGQWLSSIIHYNWFKPNVNLNYYEAAWPGSFIRAHTETQVYNPDKFVMNLGVIKVPYEYVFSAGLHRITYFPGGTEDYLNTEVP